MLTVNEYLSLAGLSRCLQVRPEAYPMAQHLKRASLGQALAILTNIRLGWKGLPERNTLAYYENS
jgi:hypothetical protein